MLFVALFSINKQAANAATKSLFVKLKANSSTLVKQNLYLDSQVTKTHQFKSIDGLELLEFSSEHDLKVAFNLYKKNPIILYVEHDNEVQLREEPNDPQFYKQWGLQNIGASSQSIDIDINAPEAWTFTTGSSDVIIGIIDTGVDYRHPDLIDNLWKNPKEIPDNQIDDDQNGYIDDVYGINVIDNSGDPLDDNRHGTHVAGIIAAVGNNSIGISGVTQKASLISCKFLNESGAGTISGAIACLDYFNNLHIPILATNNSWGGNYYSKALYDAIFSHLEKGILFISAAGNFHTDNDLIDVYPSNYNLPNIMTVAAIDQAGQLASFSNYGRHTVQVAAPGDSIFSTIIQDYGELSGTSMATPFVTGLAGLIKSYNPEATWSNIKNRIIASGKSLDSLSKKTLTGKIIKAYTNSNSGALNCENQIMTMHISPPTDALSIELGSTITLSAIHINCGDSLGNLDVVFNNQKTMTIPDDGTGNDLIKNDGVNTKEWTPNSLGTYYLRFSEQDQLSVNVYDSNHWQSYETIKQPNFLYRTILGDKLDSDDEIVTILNSPFAFPFAGGTANDFILYVGSNGTISVTDQELADFYNLSLPQSAWISLVSVYWDDLKPIKADPDSGIFYEIQGKKPNRELIIEWRNLRPYHLDEEAITFQVVFFENSSDILFNYLDVDCSNPEYNNGKSATIGIQTKLQLYKLYSYNTASIRSRSSLLFQLRSTLQSSPYSAQF